LRKTEIVVIGTSMGGLRALKTIFPGLPAEFCVPIAVVQHRHKASGDGLAVLLGRSAQLPIVDVEDQQPIEPGFIYLAPADYHLYVERGSFSLSTDAAVSYSRPSIDVLFESAADAYTGGVIGIVLTGANCDGAKGAQRIKEVGGLVVVQDPETAEAPAMPRAAIEATQVDQILRLEEIAPYLVKVCKPARERSNGR
jgi:two-component system, chemotaxis family, protein-glutamate methylesterase/glutaminase